ncbi:MAG: O-antigen ligase family protein [Alphaproteobacteria bacterium]
MSGSEPMLLGLVFSVVALVAALTFTHSRAGMAVSVLGVLVLLALAQWRHWRHLSYQIFLVMAVVLVAVGELEGRMPGLFADVDQRMRVWRLSWELLAQRPWLGHGLGAFADAFQAIRPVQITQVWLQAHNSWLELMIELGIPAAFSLFLAVGWAVVRCLVGVVGRRNDRHFPALGAAAGVLVGTHALVDFSVQIPAVAYFLAALMGIGVAQSWSGRLGRVVE